MQASFLTLSTSVILTLLLYGCYQVKVQEQDLGSPIDIIISKEDGYIVALVSNKSKEDYVTRVTRSGELIYDGIYAYDSLFCVTKNIRLSTITDVFASLADTVRANEKKRYPLDLYTPFIAEVLDSTSIYAFSFANLSAAKTEVVHHILTARAYNGKHQFVNIKTEVSYSNGEVRIVNPVDSSVCEFLAPVEVPD